MRNIQLRKVVSNGADVAETLRSCEAFVKDNLKNVFYIAKADEIVVLHLNGKVDRTINWSVQRASSNLIDLHLLSDSDEIAATFSNGTILLINTEENIVSEGGFVNPLCDAAAWSPDLAMLIVSDGKFVQFYDRMLQSISITELNTSVQGRDELVSVGWGSAETQFQGSIGKACRERKLDISRMASENDSKQTHIKWRADAQFVVISFYEKKTRERRMSVFNRHGDLTSWIKNEFPIEEWFAIRPIGNYIATIRKNTELLREIVFFERNGEKRYETTMLSSGEVIGLGWDMEASCLAVLLRYPKFDEVEIWTVSNYDWARKWATRFFSRVVDWSWDFEKVRHLDVICSNGFISQMSFNLSYCVQNSRAIVQASGEIRFTNFNRSIIPPPMCESSIPIQKAPHAMAFDGDRLAIVFSDWNMQTFVIDPVTQTLELSGATPVSVLPGTRFVSSMSWAMNNLIMVSYGDAITIDSLNLDGKVIRIYQEDNSIEWMDVNPVTKLINYATSDGIFCEIKNGCSIKMFTLEPSDCYDIRYFGEDLVVRTGGNDLWFNDRLVAESVSSFLISDDICLYITLQHKLQIISLTNGFHKIVKERDVELGSRLVSSSWLESNVVMQMPRGNLEVIYPRPFIIRNLEYLMSSQKYMEALKIMKKHRINMNLLVDHNPSTFLSNVKHFIRSTNDPDLINLFIASLSNEKNEWCDKRDSTFNKVLRISELIADEVLSLTLESRLQMFTVLLSALLKIDPPRIEPALKYIKQHTDQMSISDKSNFTRKWLHHIGFFVNESKLFNAALSTYDLALVVQVAEVSNRDPKEYIPLLNELKNVEPEDYRKYRIDVVREDWICALRHLSKLDDKFDEVIVLVTEKNLYSYALSIYQSTVRYKDICNLYASHLEKKAVWTEAAILYEKANSNDKVLQCLEMARNVDAYIHHAQKFNCSINTIKSTVLKMAGTLKGSRNWLEAAKALEFAEAPTFEIIDAYSKANKWLRAVDILDTVGLWVECGQLSNDGLLLREFIMERANRLLDDIMAQEADIEAYAVRLEAVRTNKNQRISSLKEGLLTHRDIENVDAFSDATSIFSMSSSKSGSKTSTTSAMRKKKQIDRKKRSLKEGGEYEDSALLINLASRYEWINCVIEEMYELLPSLVRLNEIELAANVQRSLIKLLRNVQSRQQQIWPQKLQPHDLPGPLHALYSVSGVFSFPDDGGMPSTVTIEPEMIAPSLNTNANWILEILR